MGSSRPNKNIVVIEPDKDTRDLSAVLFEEADLGVVECATWRDGLAALERAGPSVAMVFADVEADGDGRRLAAELNRRWPEVRLVLTGRRGARTDLPPGSRYMPKPWRPLEVLIAAETAAGLRA
ncbi:response regulator [Oharaeibacter diazotrophicus]|uniref:Response regulatory domain-containing protein n=1 Tax=Oharaeibacter diazotrophicus TaxID=1920512 RepID=A0A4R6R9J6_9HYPH|nr:response regulator [Oharaeibacter diazotrophicus]TDP82741.1 hypothetical protein EDD54_4013 [Oharaeibacter diazotrophicus]BBE72497.1 hypothetical protein OHA_1_02092 [Pleomorphomonas sp. SM30]GLS76528.1 hypothetical protein GCM10007904_18650 [Oharaeibacter diazotrophicus]